MREDAYYYGGMITIPYGTDPDQVIDKYEQYSSARPRIVLIHGGYWGVEWNRDHFKKVAQALSDLTWNVSSIEYRRRPGNPDLLVKDVRSALDTFVNEKIILIGFSAGGHLALVTERFYSNVVAVIGLAPVADMEETERLGLGQGAVVEWLNGPATSRPDLNPMKMPSPKVPLYIIQGNVDDRVPYELTQGYIRYCKSGGTVVTFFPLDNIGHFEFTEPEGATWEALLAALEHIQ